MSTFVRPVLSGRQKQLRRFRFRSLMEIKCHGNILASNCVLILPQCPRLCAQPAPFFRVLSGPRRCCCWTQSNTNLHVFTMEIRSRVRERHPRHCFLSAVFFFFCVFIFGQGRQIDDGVTDSQCILGKARNVVINSKRFSFTMAYCLAVGGSEPVAAEPRRQGCNH